MNLVDLSAKWNLLKEWVMNADEVREWTNRHPFEPFELKLSDGESFEIRHPEMIALGKRRAAVYTTDNDSFTFVTLIHINSIRSLQSAS